MMTMFLPAFSGRLPISTAAQVRARAGRNADGNALETGQQACIGKASSLET